MANKTNEVSGTVVCGVKAPRLAELKSRPCSIEELQAALVQLIDVTNFNQMQHNKLAEAVVQKADKPWQATI